MAPRTETPYRFMIGLEVHVELGTQTKMFCRCLNSPFGAEPNRHVCPVCFGLPGALPVPNKEAVRRTIVVGKALGSQIPRLSKWDRKHYFYPDLPKGYQISQYDLPLCVGGSLELLDDKGNVESTVRFERVHLEEDAGKLLHTGRPGYSKVDLNRAGVPLIEMVSKPDMTSPEQARRFLQEVRLLMRTLGVSDADMEKGQMRCDVNVSILFEHDGQAVHTPVTEIKNVNSTRAVERSLAVEAERHYAEWLAGGEIRERTGKLTAGWDEDKERIRINRTKEAAHEYRYFPEPDLPPISPYDDPELDPEKVRLPELPNAIRRRYVAAGILPADAEFILVSEKTADIERYAAEGLPLKEAAKWLINVPVSAGLEAGSLKELSALTLEGAAAFSQIRDRIGEIVSLAEKQPSRPVREILSELHLLQEHDESVVQLAIAEVMKEQPAAVADYRSGSDKVLGFLVGMVMKKTAGKAQAAKVQEALKIALQTDK